MVAALLVAGCAPDSMADDTAEISIDGAGESVFTLDACGVDDDTLLVLGSDDDDRVVQIAVGVVADGDGFVADDAIVGVTIDGDGSSFAAFTPVAWDRRGGTGDAPGSVTSVELRGSRLSISARAESETGTSVAVAIESRCDGDERGDVSAASFRPMSAGQDRTRGPA